MRHPIVLAAIALVATNCVDATSAPTMPADGGSNQACESCHPVHAAQFATARHARATESDTFRALRSTATESQRGFCDSCHSVHQAGDERGVGCVTCHQAVGNEGTHNAQLLSDPTGPMRGSIADPVANSAHASARGGFVGSSDLCGTCHEVAGFAAFVETPYTEWSQSPAAIARVTCAGCHMSPDPGNADAPRAQGPAAVESDGGAMPTRALADHRFIGPDDDRAGDLLAHAASIVVEQIARDAQSVSVTVRVTNRNAGHAFPSGARFAREVWLEVSVRAGTSPWRVVSGALDADGAPVRENTPRVELGDDVTHGGMPALPTQADAIHVRANAAGATVSYPFVVPASVDGAPVTAVQARLRYRAISYALRVALGLAPANSPVFDVATGQVGP